MTDSIIIVAGFGFFLGWSLNTMYRQYKDDQIFNKIMIKIDEEEEKEDVERLMPLCYIEQEGDEYFLYNKKTAQFYGQATTYEELAKRMLELGIKIACVKTEGKSMWFVNGHIEDFIK
jgi:N-acetylneuraminic acid mutarotase